MPRRCSVASRPSDDLLIAARAVQGAAAALLVPGSLAIISASFRREDRGRAIGAWAGLAGVATAVGPFIGGWLIDAVSWRAVFLINLPVIAVTIVITLRHVPETRDVTAARHVDGLGGALLALGLAGVVYGLIEGPGSAGRARRLSRCSPVRVALALFLVVEARSTHPMVPLDVFRSRQFSGANAVTFAVYAALGVTMFLLVVHLQTDLGYSALEAGASLLPLTVLMLLFSARAGALAQRIGPRLPMTIGPLIAGGGHRDAVGSGARGVVLVRGVPGRRGAERGSRVHRRATHRDRARRGRRCPRGSCVGDQQRGRAHRGV